LLSLTAHHRWEEAATDNHKIQDPHFENWHILHESCHHISGTYVQSQSLGCMELPVYDIRVQTGILRLFRHFVLFVVPGSKTFDRTILVQNKNIKDFLSNRYKTNITQQLFIGTNIVYHSWTGHRSISNLEVNAPQA